MSDEILQDFGMKMSFFKAFPKLSNNKLVSNFSPWSQGRKHHPEENHVQRMLPTKKKENGNYY